MCRGGKGTYKDLAAILFCRFFKALKMPFLKLRLSLYIDKFSITNSNKIVNKQNVGLPLDNRVFNITVITILTITSLV